LKKFIIFIALIIGVYKFYPYVLSPDQIKALTSNGAFDANGNPQTILFVADYCKQPCTDTAKHLKSRRVTFTTINISNDEASLDLYKSYGGTGRGLVPLTVSGYEHVNNSDRMLLTSMLAKSYGEKVLTRAEKSAMKGHFSEDGSPRLVMYGTERCGYCIKAREYFSDNNVPFVELDIDKSMKAKRHYTTLRGTGTPLIYMGYHRIVGFNKNQLADGIRQYKF